MCLSIGNGVEGKGRGCEGSSDEGGVREDKTATGCPRTQSMGLLAIDCSDTCLIRIESMCVTPVA